MKFQQFGKYTILKKIAGGGMAEIFLACDLGPTGIGRFLAIKKALARFSKNVEFIDMFKNEGRVACNLKHGNIAPIYEFGIESDQLYLSMEYISGRNLRELIRRAISKKSPLEIPHSIHIVKEVAAGLNYAHNAVDSSTGQPLHLIHRDVSPQNVMVSFDGEVKIIDFGIAKIANTELTKAGNLKGKFGYMSPEQTLGEKLDMRGDIFCLGIILWELLANKRLFKCDNEMATLRKVQVCDIPKLQSINPQVPSDLEKVVMKALAKNKNSRYKTALEFERNLNKILTKIYPEFDRYDFTGFIKKIYSKDILNERESLKKYSKQFKEYTKLCYEEELSYESVIDTEQTGFNTLGPEGEQPSLSAQKTITQTEEEYLTGPEKDPTKNKPGVSATKTYEKSLLTKSMGGTGSLRLTNPHTAKTIIKTNGGGSQLSRFVTDQLSKSYTVDSISNKRPSIRKNPIEFVSYRKKIIVPLFYVTLSLGICGGVIWGIMNTEVLVDLARKLAASQAVEKNNPNKEQVTAQKDQKRHPTSASTSMQTEEDQSPEVQHTTIFVRTKPSGASVFVNRKFAIRTPNVLKIKNGSSGPIEILISKKGYRHETITAGKVTDLKQNINVNLIRRNTEISY